jgi:prophage antirepressor-like protein
MMLGYALPRKAILDHCRGVLKRNVSKKGGNRYGSFDCIGEVNFIPEGDLYRLIANSKLPSAERFESWVFDEVLPSIRQYGFYMTKNVVDEIVSNPQNFVKLFIAYNQKNELCNQQQQVIEELEPKGEYYDNVLQSETGFPITEIAKEYGLEGRCLNQMLHTLKIQYHVGRVWVLTKPYCGKGYTKTKTYPKPN